MCECVCVCVEQESSKVETAHSDTFRAVKRKGFSWYNKQQKIYFDSVFRPVKGKRKDKETEKRRKRKEERAKQNQTHERTKRNGH